MILQCARNDLGRRRCAAVNQHHNRHCFQDFWRIGQRVGTATCVELFRGEILGAAAVHATFGVDHQRVFRQEHCRQSDRSVKQTTGVVAQIKHHAFERRLRVLLSQYFGHIRHRRLVEHAHSHERNTGLNELGFDALNLDLLARQRVSLRAAIIFAEHFQLDLGAGQAAHQVNGLGGRQSAGGLAVDFGNQVA